MTDKIIYLYETLEEVTKQSEAGSSFQLTYK